MILNYLLKLHLRSQSVLEPKLIQYTIDSSCIDEANGSHCESAVYPSPKMKPSTRFPRVASIDIGVLHEDEAMEIKKEEAARPKLDIEQVMLQLSLMRKFGFDVKQFETKLKKALAS
eukprot:617511_1